MHPSPGLPQLVAYCRQTAGVLDQRVKELKLIGKRPIVRARLEAASAVWHGWADDLEKLLDITDWGK